MSPRPLSDLQKKILELALANRIKEGRGETSNGADLYTSEILVRVYGFTTVAYSAETDEARARRLPGHHIIERTIVGRDRYNSAQAAISRATGRLAARGLVSCIRGLYAGWAGVDLTADGIEVAKALLGEAVNTRVKTPKC